MRRAGGARVWGVAAGRKVGGGSHAATLKRPARACQPCRDGNGRPRSRGSRRGRGGWHTPDPLTYATAATTGAVGVCRTGRLDQHAASAHRGRETRWGAVVQKIMMGQRSRSETVDNDARMTLGAAAAAGRGARPRVANDSAAVGPLESSGIRCAPRGWWGPRSCPWNVVCRGQGRLGGLSAGRLTPGGESSESGGGGSEEDWRRGRRALVGNQWSDSCGTGRLRCCRHGRPHRGTGVTVCGGPSERSRGRNPAVPVFFAFVAPPAFIDLACGGAGDRHRVVVPHHSPNVVPSCGLDLYRESKWSHD